MKPFRVEASNSETLLAGADFADAYAVIVEGRALDPLGAAERAMGRAPGWVRVALRARNLIVRPFGLKVPDPGPGSGVGPMRRVGIFPLISEAADHVVLGLDDRHLDFRVRVQVADLGQGRQRVTVLTAVRTHNAAGRAYLCAVMPFHRRIVPAMLAQVSRA